MNAHLPKPRDPELELDSELETLRILVPVLRPPARRSTPTFIRPPLDGEDMRYVQITPRVRCIGYKVVRAQVRAQESCGTTLLNETYKVSSV